MAQQRIEAKVISYTMAVMPGQEEEVRSRVGFLMELFSNVSTSALFNSGALKNLAADLERTTPRWPHPVVLKGE
jgi:hypothetical protein